MKNLLPTITIVLFTICNACDSTEPPPPIDNGKLEYNWTVDTLKNPNGYGVIPWSIWGSSSQSVWIAGFNLANQGEIFHYDGNSWIRQTPDLGFNYEVLSIFGFAENDVYVAGYKIIIDTVLHTESLILHYDGLTWQKENILLGSGLRYVHGANPSDIWACGSYGSLYHKTGSSWEKIIFDENLNLGPIFVSPEGNVYMMSFPAKNPAPGDSAQHFFWRYSNQNWQIIDSTTIYNDDYRLVGYTFGHKSMWGMNGNDIYSAGSAVYNFNGNSWLPVTWDDYPYSDIKGTLSNKIFVVGNHGTLRYYNGIDWIRVAKYSNTIVDFYSVMPFEDEIFIGAFQLGEGYVVRGEIKK